LVDSSVLFHAITHETAWVSTGTAKWGNAVEIDTGYSARIPVHAEDCEAEVYAHIRFLPGLAHLARLGYLRLLTSAELAAEQFRQPAGRFYGYGFDGLNLFEGVRMESVDGKRFDLQDAKNKQIERIRNCADPLFRELVSVLGEKSSLDAYHILTAERHRCFCFLHMDLKLDRVVKQHARHPAIRRLTVKILLPSALGEELKLVPMSPRFLSFENLSLFSRPDLFVPGQMRRKPSRTV